MNYIKRLFFVIVLCLLGTILNAEIISGNAGYAFDLPEGYVEMGVSPDGNVITLANTVLPVQLAIRLYSADFEPKTALENIFLRLNATGDIAGIVWRNTECRISEFSMLQGNTSSAGWALAVNLPESGPNAAVLVVLSYADSRAAQIDAVQNMILSTLDSLLLDDESWYEPGPVTAFAYPAGALAKITLEIDGKQIAAEIDVDAAEASHFVIEREYALLLQYGNTEFARAAWQRYYRMIFRDSYDRLKTPAFAIFDALQSKNEEERLITLLSWVQKFPYARNRFSTNFTPLSDFTPLPAVLAGESSDCDSRAMLLAVLMHHMGSDTAFFVSNVYQHALMGIAIDIEGAKIEKYLIAETTAPVAPGLIAEDMAKTENWITVLFPR